MGKKHIRTLVFGALMSASLLSFIFITTLPQSQAGVSIELRTERFDEKETREGTHLPDVTLVKKAFDMARRFIPAY